MLYKWCIGVITAAHTSEGGPIEVGGLSASNLPLISIPHPTQMPDGPAKAGEVSTVWMHHMDANKTLRKNVNENHTRMLSDISNKSSKQHPTIKLRYFHLPPISKTIQERGRKHAGYYRRSKKELIRDVFRWIPTHGHDSVGRSARIYLLQLCEETGCSCILE